MHSGDVAAAVANANGVLATGRGRLDVRHDGEHISCAEGDLGVGQESTQCEGLLAEAQVRATRSHGRRTCGGVTCGQRRFRGPRRRD